MELSREDKMLLDLVAQMEDDGRYICESEDGMLGFMDQKTEEVVMLVHESRPVADLIIAYAEFKAENSRQ